MKRIINVALVCAVLITAGVMTCTGAHAASKPAAPTITSVTSGTSCREGEVTVKWKKISANGYQLQYSLSKGFSGAGSWTTGSASAVSRTVTGLKKGSVYYFRVRTVKGSGSSRSYSSWSSTAQITAHEHEYSSQVTDPAGCGKAGAVSYTCNGCGYAYQEELSPLSHVYVKKISKKATSKASGTAKYTCKSCGDCFTETIPKLSSKSAAKKESATKPSSKPAVRPTSKETTKTPSKPSVKQSVKADSKPETGPQGAESATVPSSAAKKPLTRGARTIKARKAAVSWAIAIADNNTFHYGRTRWAHKTGCYFCGTNQRAGSGKRKAGASLTECAKTYCCNPFVTAEYHHGAGASEIDCRVKHKRINLANDRNRALKNKKAFARISKPSSIDKLCEGDILLTPTHCMLYAGNGKVVHAAHHDNGKRNSYWNSSIVHEKISNRQWKRTSKIYRYIGTGRY